MEKVPVAPWKLTAFQHSPVTFQEKLVGQDGTLVVPYQNPKMWCARLKLDKVLINVYLLQVQAEKIPCKVNLQAMWSEKSHVGVDFLTQLCAEKDPFLNVILPQAKYK